MDMGLGIGRGLSALQARWARRRSRWILRDMSDRQLADIGLAPRAWPASPWRVHEPTQRWLDSLP